MRHEGQPDRHARTRPEGLNVHLRVTAGSRPYRARDGVIFGVCKGLSRYLDANVVGLRLIAVVVMFVTGFWPVIIAYIIAALLMKPEPVMPLETEEDAEFYNSFTSSRKMALQRLKRTYDNLDRRIQRIESTVTARDYDWERRFHENG